MSGWEDYPADYRASEVQMVLTAVSAGECVSIVGLSGAGKSNLMGFLANRCGAAYVPSLLFADGNRLAGNRMAHVFALLGDVFGCEQPLESLSALEPLVEKALRQSARGACVLFDRFDALNVSDFDASPLRALRDRFKYRLTYVTATRRVLQARGELAELFYANTIWLGPLSPTDAEWSAGQYARRRGQQWGADVLQRLVELSWGYPAFLRAACEAYASGCPLDAGALRAHPALERRIAEFWADQPTPEDLRKSRLEGHPWLAHLGPAGLIDPADLTAAEQRLLDHLRTRSGQVCLKDDLIRAVWPDEVVAAGLRDDSLAQLVHRLREKIGARQVQTIPGRGYRYQR